MKTIKKDELFQNLSDFLKSKGISLTDGAYSRSIRQGCNLLSDAINATQRTVKNAKGKVDEKLGQVRQTIHQATAPKTSKSAGQRTSQRRRKKSPRQKTGSRPS